MIKRFFFFISALVFLYGSTSFSTASYSLTTHTQHTPTGLEPTSLNTQDSFQVASVCFLGSVVGCGDSEFDKGDSTYEIDPIQQCKNEGYIISFCPLPSYPVGQCPYDSALFLKCEIDNERACKESGYKVFICGTDEVVDASCPYDSNYKKCKCNPCDGYDYTYAQATVTGYVTDGSCQSCGETKYKRKPNPCSGYMSCECGGEIGASVCYSGSAQKFDSCKPCCNEACPAGTTETNPGGCGGTTQNECKTKTCYYSYKECCVPNCPSISCQEGQTYVASGSDGCGGKCPYCTWNVVGNYVWCSDSYEKPGTINSFCYSYRHKNILYNGDIVNGASSENERCRTTYNYMMADREQINCGSSRYF